MALLCHTLFFKATIVVTTFSINAWKLPNIHSFYQWTWFLTYRYSLYICNETLLIFHRYLFFPSQGFPQSAEGSRSEGSGRGQTGPGDPDPRHAWLHGGWKCRSKSL